MYSKPANITIENNSVVILLILPCGISVLHSCRLGVGVKFYIRLMVLTLIHLFRFDSSIFILWTRLLPYCGVCSGSTMFANVTFIRNWALMH